MNTTPRQNTYKYYQEVHRKMQNLYSNNTRDIEQAKELQSFLYTIKSLGKNEQPGQGLVNSAAVQIWEEAQRLGGLKTGAILNRGGGQQLEKDLSNIILATLPDKIRKQVINNINLGAKHFNIGDKNSEAINLLPSSDIVKAMRDLRPDLKTYINANQKTGFITLRSTPGKIDVAGPNITMTMDIQFDSPELEKYYNLLKDATFTAKNYKSESKAWNKHFGSFVRDLETDIPNIHLGNSDPYKAVFSSLQFLGYPTEVIKSAFYAAYWRLKYKNIESDDIGSHIWHLRFAYELTGRGSHYTDIAFSALDIIGARFLIYNDPSSDFISVTSTAELIKEVLLDGQSKENPFGDSITIAKSHLKNISRSY